jgi:hypothetical protein
MTAMKYAEGIDLITIIQNMDEIQWKIPYDNV